MPKVIAVVGATGAQGGAVARTFLALPDWTVRAITRNTSSSAALELQTLGAALVAANLDDVSSLITAFTGADAIFGVTDFWQFPKDPKTHEMAKQKGITWNEASYLLELQHGKNIIDAAATVLSTPESKLERLVLSSLADVRKASQDKYTWAYHFDSKAHFVKYLKDKADTVPDYRALFKKTSYLQMGYYLDNWRIPNNPILTPRKQTDGSFVWKTIVANDPRLDKKEHLAPFVHPPTDTGPFVSALVLKAPPQTTMLGTCAQMSFSEYVRLWGETLHVRAKTEDYPVDDVIRDLPDGFGLEVAETSLFVKEYGWDGGEGAKLPWECGVNREDLMDVKRYIEETDWSAVLGRYTVSSGNLDIGRAMRGNAMNLGALLQAKAGWIFATLCSTTITTTITSWSTVYTTSTSTDTQYTTSVIISSLWSTAWTTVSNAQTATEVIRTTLSSAKQRRTVAAEYDGETRTIQPTSSEQDQHPRPHTIATDSVQVPVVTLLTYAEYDSVARDLQNLGVIVKRQTTITSTSTAYTSATTTVQSVEVSSELLTVWVTSTTHLITTKTTYVDAQVTVSVTSTITPPEPTSTSSSPTTSPSSSQPITSSPSTGNGPPSSAGAAPVSATSTTPAVGAGGGGGGLSKGAEVGIGVGTAAGSLIICTIILFWWRRRRRHPDKQGNDPSSPMAPAGGFHSQSEQKSELPGNHAMQENYPQMYPYSPNSAGTGYGAPLPAYHDGYAPNGPVPAEAPAHEQYTPQHQNQGQRPQSFQYAPYELYDERPQELYNHRYERGLRLSEAE
ncbi:hypothetical protein H2200_009425 [Cladophialophora chaetospira]|uniref:NmrA-like domain-containing protein n=1 Tax=Cladophialophora chaetospira TaxID=386627 RepID=A0AA38X433_9EURO|nr:hypothetical protein H2200_009425 [Cladophialophora chaetospira]